MSAIDTINNLLTLGVQVKEAATKSGQTVASFVESSDFKSIQDSVTNVLKSLQPQDLQSAVKAIQQKETDFLNGRQIADLSTDELTQFNALADVEHQLVIKLLKQPNPKSFLTVLVNDVLPVLVQAAKTVILLLT